MEKNLTSGSVLKNILCFSLPYLLSYFLQTLYGMADLFIIGQFEGVAGTTAVSVGSQVMHMITVMIVGLAMGSTVTIAQAIGARDKKSVSKTIGNTATLFMAAAIGLMVILLLLVHPIVSVMSTPSEAVSGTAAYLTVCFIGIPCITAYNIISSVFRGLGDSRSPMYFIAIACVVNIGLDYLFMGYFQCHYCTDRHSEKRYRNLFIRKRFSSRPYIHAEDSEYRYSSCPAGWFYSDRIYRYHGHCQQTWARHGRCCRYC